VGTDLGVMGLEGQFWPRGRRVRTSGCLTNSRAQPLQVSDLRGWTWYSSDSSIPVGFNSVLKLRHEWSWGGTTDYWALAFQTVQKICQYSLCAATVRTKWDAG
jgi:hypothetical protein